MEGAYPVSQLLVETEWLAQHLDDPGVRVVDADVPLEYGKAHIPGAAGVPDQRFKSSESPLYTMEPSAFERLMESLGIGDDTLVVAYDSHRSLYAARLWWMLGYYGHMQVRVLNGGWRKWCAEGRPIEVATHAHSIAAGGFEAKPQRPWRATLDDLKAAYDEPGVVVWDVRGADEYTGASDRGNARQGHVPGARHLEWSSLVNDSDHTFKPASEMRRALEEAGVTSDKTVYTY